MRRTQSPPKEGLRSVWHRFTGSSAGGWTAGLHCLLQTIKKNCPCHRYLVGASPSFKNIYSSGKISQGRQGLELCFRQRGLALFLKFTVTWAKIRFFCCFFQRKSTAVLPGPIVLLSPYCPLTFPGAQESSWEEKDPTSVFLAYNWLIIFGSAAAGPPPPPAPPPGGGTDGVSAAPLALFVRQQSNTVDAAAWRCRERTLVSFSAHVKRKLSHAALKAGSLILTRLPLWIPALFIYLFCQGGDSFNGIP